MDFAPLKYVIPGYVVEGLTLLGGKPKLGKSWWAYDASIAVATGGKAMGVQRSS
jgi:RecA-family ATPase